MDLWGPWAHQKGGEPNWFERNVPAHAAAHADAKVGRTQKRVRLPPPFMPVTHLLFEFPGRSGSLHFLHGVDVLARRVHLASSSISAIEKVDLAGTEYQKINPSEFREKNHEGRSFEAYPRWRWVFWGYAAF